MRAIVATMKIQRRLKNLSRNGSAFFRGGLNMEAIVRATKQRYGRTTIDEFKSLVTAGPDKRALDLGCGRKPQNIFNFPHVSGIDFESHSRPDILAADLSAERIPFDSASVDLITCLDFLEHIPRWERMDGKVRFPFVELMNEIHRTLKTGGLVFSRTPAFPSQQSFRDPTHVNFITEETFPKYFCGPVFAEIYGFSGEFEIVKQGWSGSHLLTLMRKIEPSSS